MGIIKDVTDLDFIKELFISIQRFYIAESTNIIKKNKNTEKNMVNKRFVDIYNNRK